MPIITSPPEATHDLGGTRFTSLATPTTGTAQTSVWIVEIEPGTPAAPHSLTHEEVFVVLEGTAVVALAGRTGIAEPGDAIVVPPDTTFEVSNGGVSSLRMICCLPVGGQAVVGTERFTPPWAQ